MQSLTLPQHLTAIDCYDGKTYFKDCTTEYATQFRKAQFQALDWSVITGSNIRTLRSATSIEFYEQLILPTLPHSEKEMYSRIRSSLPEKVEKDIKLEQIFSVMDRKRNEESYYQEISRPLSKAEIERNKLQVANRPQLNFS